jgi:hypothetical protein
LTLARRIHGPAAFCWTLLVGAHVLVYLRRALRSAHEELVPRTRRAAVGAVGRTLALGAAIASGVALGVATLPAQHHWLHLPPKHDHGRG